MAKEEKKDLQEFPKEVQLEKKLVICPKCKTHIEVDLTIDISPVTNIIEAIQAGQAMTMSDPEAEEDK